MEGPNRECQQTLWTNNTIHHAIIKARHKSHHAFSVFLPRYFKISTAPTINKFGPETLSCGICLIIVECLAACQASTYSKSKSVSRSVIPTLCNPMDCSPPGSCPWVSQGKNTGVGSDSLLQGIFLHCTRILHRLSHQGRGSPHLLQT